MYICIHKSNDHIVKSFLPSLVLATYCLLWSCHNDTKMPAPTGKTTIHQNGEDEGMAELRKKWIHLLHGGDQSQWTTIENQNQKDMYRKWLSIGANVRSDNE